MAGFDCSEKLALVMDESVDTGVRDEALYWLITNALRLRLKRRFRPYERRVPFTFDDALQEYFLYLRGDPRAPYSMLRGVTDPSAAGSWMLSTFRNFVSKKARYGVPIAGRDVSNIPETPDDNALKMASLSVIIAYCYQELPKVQRFVFLRMMLTFLDRSRALPQRDIATVLGMSHVYYRVLNNRVSSVVAAVKRRLANDESLPLGPDAAELRHRLSADSGGWYDVLAAYYDLAVASFAQAGEINALRYQFYEDSPGLILHDFALAA